MKILNLILLILISTQFVSAQIYAITETGDEVVLYNDGSWMYLSDENSERGEIPVNDTEFLKDDNSTFLVKSKNVDMGIYIDPVSWKFSKGSDEDGYEYLFEMKGEDLYAMLISEKVQIPVETLQQIAIENARSVAPDIRVVKEEYRTVNGLKLLHMQMSGSIQGIKLTYYGYYYSNSSGTIQLLAYTGEYLLNTYINDIELLLNGFVDIQ